MKTRPPLHRLLLLCTLFALSRNAAAQSTNSETVTINEIDAGDFAQRIAEATPRTTFLFAVESVSLDTVLSIQSRGVRLIGANATATRIRCRDDGRVEIRATGVDVVNLTFEECLGGAVTLLNPDAVYDPFNIDAVYSFRNLRVNFTRVQFLDNVADPNARDVKGGGLTVGPGTQAVVEDCEFRRNKASTGGGILVDGAGSLNVKKTLFEENEASIAGGAIAAGLTENFFGTIASVSIKKCRFRRNRDVSGGEDPTGLTLSNGAPLENAVFLKFPSPTPSGGAIYVHGYSSVRIEKTDFEENTAVPAGGAIYVSDNDDVIIVECSFVRNRVTSVDDASQDRVTDLEAGGAIYVVFTSVLSRARIDRCVFRNNTASYGGAIHAVTELVTEISIENSQFEDNEAQLAGGAILMRNVISARLRNVRFNRNRATAGGGVMLTNGAGAVFFKGPFDGIDLDVYFTENAALDGAGLFLLGAGQVVLQGVRYYRNRAGRNGGGLCLLASLPSGQTTLQTNYFESNAARRGGAVYVDSVSNFELYSVDDGRNAFVRNRALAGGAIHVRPSSPINNLVRIRQAVFRGNEAVRTIRDAGIDRLDLPDVQIETTALGRRLLFLRTLMQEKTPESTVEDVLLDPESFDACHPGGGGAVCVLATQVPEQAPVEIEISDVTMTRNKAFVGGAVFAATPEEEDWIATCASEGTAVESLTSKPCKSFAISSTAFTSNKATAAGGALFVSHPASAYVDASENGRFVQLSGISPAEWNALSANAVEKGGFGEDIATRAASLVIRRPDVTAGALLVEGHNSGDDLPTIQLDVQDVFGQTVRGGISDANMSVSIDSVIISGQRVATAESGSVVFSKATAIGNASIHSLTFVPRDGQADVVLEQISIRQCFAGESKIEIDDTRHICDPCDQEQFGFNYSYPCDGCPDNARCSGKAVLIPVSGYWHSTPYSPIMHECLLEEACQYKGRRKRLEAYYKESASLVPSQATVSNEEYPQCAEEYTGPLCGSCVKGYGHVIDGECVECRQVWLTAILIGVVCLWTLFLLVSTARAAFDTIREMHDMRLVRALTMNTARGGMKTGGKSQIGMRPSQRGRGLRSSMPRQPTDSHTGGPSSEGDDVTGDQSPSSQSPLTEKYATSGDLNVDHIMAAEIVSETIKILTNFFQITAVGVGINASWTRSIRFLLIIEDSVSSISSGASFAPMECLFEDLDDRTIVGIVLRTLFPLVLTALYILVNHIKHIDDKDNARRRAIIGFIVGIFFAYDTITEMLMRIVNCVSLDDPNLEDPDAPLTIQRYADYATARDSYWAEDTQHVCWEGSHGLVAGILGIPGLLIITAGIPIGLALFLLYKRHRGVVLEPQCLNTYGFVYQSYQAKFVFWESIIMLRKVSMAAVIVYAYDLGPNLQSAIALGILIFALLAQFLAQPYKYASLNLLESLSLLASIFIFYSGVVFRDPNTSYGGKVVLSIIIIVTNVFMVGLFVYRLLVAYDQLIIVKLRLEKAEYIPERAIERVKLLSSINAAKLKESLQEKLQKSGSGRREENKDDTAAAESSSP